MWLMGLISSQKYSALSPSSARELLGAHGSPTNTVCGDLTDQWCVVTSRLHKHCSVWHPRDCTNTALCGTLETAQTVLCVAPSRPRNEHENNRSEHVGDGIMYMGDSAWLRNSGSWMGARGVALVEEDGCRWNVDGA